MKPKGKFTIAALAVLAALAMLCVAGCSTVKKVGKATTELVTGDNDPAPERSWNSERTWKRVSDTPPSYVPYTYTGPTEGRGEWITDKRDGKRLFVPTMGAEGFPESVLRAEAWKATRK